MEKKRMWTKEDQIELDLVVKENDPLYIASDFVWMKLGELKEGISSFLSVPISHHFMSSETLIENTKDNINDLRMELEGKIKQDKRIIRWQTNKLEHYAIECNAKGTMPDSSIIDGICKVIKRKEESINRDEKQVEFYLNVERDVDNTASKKVLLDSMKTMITVSKNLNADGRSMEKLQMDFDTATDRLENINEMVTDVYKTDNSNSDREAEALRNRILDEAGIHLKFPVVKRTEANSFALNLPIAPKQIERN